MKISRIGLFTLELPYAGGIYRSRAAAHMNRSVPFVRILGDNGIECWGESTSSGSTYIAGHALGARAGMAELTPALLGRNSRRTERIADLMDSTLIGNNHAKAALDVACWDALSKSVDLPVCELLGGSTELPRPMISSIHLGDPEEMRALVADHRARGYRVIPSRLTSPEGLGHRLSRSALLSRKTKRCERGVSNGVAE